MSSAADDESQQIVKQLHKRVADLQDALLTSRVISTAVGILIATHDLDEQSAFKLLVTISQRTNRRVNQIAADIVRDRGVAPHNG